MIQRQSWVDHKFHLGIAVGWTQNVLSRLQDTSVRIEHHCKTLSDDLLSKRVNNAWSMKEHIGHLTDLEELWIGRFQEFRKSESTLSMADMSNQKTRKSNHNEQLLETLLDNFRTERKSLFRMYASLDENAQNHQAMHPRLKVYMRPVDLLFFIAEHDDHHITSIVELKKRCS